MTQANIRDGSGPKGGSRSNLSRQQGTIESVREWQTRLLQLDRRSALLYFPMGKRGVTLRGLSPDLLLERLAISRGGLAFLYAERVRTAQNLFDIETNADDVEPQIRVRPGDLETSLAPLELQKRLSTLSKKNREWQEEQGLNVLFVALGFLRWVDEEGEPACSPVLLMPCDLLRTSPRDPFFLVIDESEDIVVNPTLRHKLALAMGIELPEIAEDTVAQYLAKVASLVASHEAWRVEPSVVIATFPFSKLAMWEDLNLMISTGVTHPLVRRLAGDSEAEVPDPAGGPAAIPMEDVRLQGARLDDLLDIRDQHAVLDADFSQLRAIELARAGAHLVVHGPPGTGKSQTIANMVATLIAQGKRVLFVSEKTAALDVVKQRLTNVGLGAFCLDLHSDRGKKDSVYAQLREALDQPPANPQGFPYERLLARRTELNTIVRALHEVRRPLGLSVFAVHGRVAAIRDVPRLNVVVGDISSLNDDRLRRIQEAAQRIGRRVEQFCAHHASPWHALGPVSASPLLAHAVGDDLTRIRSAISSIISTSATASAACGVEEPKTELEAMHLLLLLGHLEKQPGAIPSPWLESEGLARAHASTEALRTAAAERQKLLTILLSSLKAVPAGAAWRTWLEAARGDLAESSRWRQLAGSEWGRNLLSDPSACAAKWQRIANALDTLQEASGKLQTLLGVRDCISTRSAAEDSLVVAQRLIRVGRVPAAWGSADAVAVLRNKVADAERLSIEIISTDNALAALFGSEIVEVVSDEMLVRYRTDYRSLWHRLGKAFRRDQRALRGCLKQPGKPTLDEATSAIERALTLRRLRPLWSETTSQLEELLGPRYTGLTSDWPGIEATLDALAVLDRELPKQERSFHALLTDGAQFALLEPAADAVVQAAASLDELWPGNASCPADILPELSRDARAFAEVAVRIGDVLRVLGSFEDYPKDVDHFIDLLQAGAQLEEIEAQASAAVMARTDEIGPSFRGWSTGFDRLDVMLNWTQELQTLVAAPIPKELVRRVIEPLAAAPYAAETSKLAAALKCFQDACGAAAIRFPEAQTPWGSWANAPFIAIQAWCDELGPRSDEASDWVDYRSAAGALDAAVGARVTDALRAATDDATLVPDTVLHHVYLSWLEAMYQAVPQLNFAPADMVDAVKEFRDLDARLPRSARERVREKCFAAYPSSTSNSNGKGELGILGHELAKRKRRLPVRKLVAKIPNLLQRLKPVFMMSPLAVSQYLPRGVSESDTLVFDTVIFDEASQVFPEDAVPAIARGRQCIVVGDQQQLPPSNFFRKGDTDDDFAEDDEAATDNQLVGVESILDVLVGMSGAGVQDVYLKVHYRSQHDALIRYSNHYFYEDRLLTYPSAFRRRSGLGVRSIYLPEGRYEAGGSRTNRVEAERVAQEVFDLMQKQPPNESIGVVALSRPQADLIQELIDLRRLSDRRFDERFAEQANERFFVKNLENVQGDERDHMILSIGYGPTTGTGLVPNRFGPINAEGGHRRLNVAVSRARKSMTVVHSLRPEDIHSEMQGARLLRRYLEYMRSGEASIEGTTSAHGEGEAESPFEEAVGRALERRGYKIERQVGCARYWIDIAVVSEDGTSFDLGIECDGATYHRSASARDRDRLRQEILERLGWRGRIHRVWSTAWIRNPQAELAAIERAIGRARTMPRESSARPVKTETAPSPQTQNRGAERSVSSQRDSAISVPSLQLPPYVLADLRAFPRYWDLRQTNPAFVAQIVKAVVETEGPVHVELVIERIREHYGLGRAGRVVREAVLAGVNTAIQLRLVAWLPGASAGRGVEEFLVTRPDCVIQPRGAMSDGSVRKIEQISNQEIEAVIIQVVNAMVGASRDETVVSAARALGYARTGNHVESRMNDAVDRLLARHILKDSMGSLVVNGVGGS